MMWRITDEEDEEIGMSGGNKNGIHREMWGGGGGPTNPTYDVW